MQNPLWMDMIDAANHMIADLRLSSRNNQKTEDVLSSHQKNLFFCGLKNWGLTQIRVKRLCKKLPPHSSMAILSIAFGMINQKRYSEFTIVDQSVEAVKKIQGRKLASLVNFILRDTLKNLIDAACDKQNPIAKWNAPLWWQEKIKKQFDSESFDILRTNKFHPPLTLRVAFSHKNKNEIKLEVETEQSKVLDLGFCALGVIPPYDVTKTRMFKDGIISIQDLNSQKVVEFITPKKNSCLLDACAAPGGKTFAIASKFPFLNIISSDISGKRLEKLKKDLIRQKKYLLSQPKIIRADLCGIDSKKKLFSMSNNGFDYIVLDAPCTGSGIVRRHPEIPWNKSPQELKKLSILQSKMLKSAWCLLKRNGILLYSVCSIFSEEGVEQIRKFCSENKNVEVLKELLFKPTANNKKYGSNEIDNDFLGADGFFYGVLKKIED